MGNRFLFLPYPSHLAETGCKREVSPVYFPFPSFPVEYRRVANHFGKETLCDLVSCSS